ncbi:MAG: hypothetical protein QXL94_06525 [Candidatus Parvarchaeum sp.]
MVFKSNSIILIGLSLFVIGLILPFIDIFIIKYYGKAAELIGSIILFIGLAVFVVGVIITLLGFHRQSRQFSPKNER